MVHVLLELLLGDDVAVEEVGERGAEAHQADLAHAAGDQALPEAYEKGMCQEPSDKLFRSILTQDPVFLDDGGHGVHGAAVLVLAAHELRHGAHGHHHERLRGDGTRHAHGAGAVDLVLDLALLGLVGQDVAVPDRGVQLGLGPVLE